MTRNTKTDYYNLAKEKQMSWVGGALPDNVRVSTLWQCNLCDRKVQKSYSKMKDGKNPCRCRSNSIITPDQYRDLADEISQRYKVRMIFIHPVPAKNTYEKVMWEIDGHQFEESYHNLAYYDKPVGIINEYIRLKNE